MVLLLVAGAPNHLGTLLSRGSYSLGGPRTL